MGVEGQGDLQRALWEVCELLKLATNLEANSDCREICLVAARRLSAIVETVRVSNDMTRQVTPRARLLPEAPLDPGASSGGEEQIAILGQAASASDALGGESPRPVRDRAKLRDEEFVWRLRADLGLGSPLVARALARLLKSPGTAIPINETIAGRTPFKVVVVRLRRDLAQHDLAAAIVTVGRKGVSRLGGYLFDPAYLDRLQARLSFTLDDLHAGRTLGTTDDDGSPQERS